MGGSVRRTHAGAETPDGPATDDGTRSCCGLTITLTIRLDEMMKAHEKEREKVSLGSHFIKGKKQI